MITHGFRRIALVSATVAAVAVLAVGCSGKHVVGGAVVGGAYEYQNKKAVRSLDRDFESGRISRDEYERRREEIDRRSLIY